MQIGPKIRHEIPRRLGRHARAALPSGGIPMRTVLSMSVLLVEDYSTMARIMRKLLAQIGFSDIDDAPDGAAALAKMRAKKYGLVISDWNMAPMSGYDLLKHVRADPVLAETPFIIVTAES